MKKTLLLSIISLFLFGQGTQISSKAETLINQAKDYYEVSMFEKSKLILLELLHSVEGEKFEAEVRYHLGICCYLANDIRGAKNQFKLIINNYPTHPRSRELNKFYNELSENKDSINFESTNDIQFNYDIKTAELFWDRTLINPRIVWDDLKQGTRAVNYYNMLLKKYEDPEKKLICLVNILTLELGFNENMYGYNNSSATNAYIGLQYITRIQMVLNSMESLISGTEDLNYRTLIRSYYMTGVKLSNNTLFTGKLKVAKESKPFFEKVLELSDYDKNNIYYIYSKFLLNKK